MAKIPHLHSKPRADGLTAWHWKPSPRLRAKGWQNHALGTGPLPARRGKAIPPDEVVTRANALNRQLEEWEAGGAAAAAAQKPAPMKWTWQDLVDAYRASPEYREAIGAVTRREYDSRIRQLTFWAQDGHLPIRAIDRDMVKDLKKALLAARPQAAEGGRTEMVPGSVFKAAAMLRVLRLLLRWAVAENLLPADPTLGVTIPTTPSRTAKLPWGTVDAIAGDASEEDALILRVAFWSLQRRDDLCGLNRLSWRQIHAVDPRDRPALVNPKGEVWGFELQQHKTGKRVVCPMPPWLHPAICAAFERSQWLFPHSQDPALAMTGAVMRRRVKPLLAAAGYPGHQLRDFRRSGMSWMEDMAALRSDICVISGHQVFGRKTILDTYMPPDAMAACRAVAAAERTRRAIEAREKEHEQ
jgi:hypothetical protein